MIQLTEAAAKRVRELQKELGAEDRMLRVYVTAGGCSGHEYGMGFDLPSEADPVLESQGIRFFTDPESLDRMSGSEIHFDDGLHGKGFEVRNPRAKSTCGCGKSFN